MTCKDCKTTRRGRPHPSGLCVHCRKRRQEMPVPTPATVTATTTTEKE